VRSVDKGTERWYKVNIEEYRGARVNSGNRGLEILKDIEGRGSVSVVDLARRFAISETAIRCDPRDVEKVALALDCGPYAVVAGTAITRAEITVGWFTEDTRNLGEKRP